VEPATPEATGRTTPSPAALVSRVAVAAVGAYVGAQVIADVTSLKIGNVADRAVDMGTFIYPITFTLSCTRHWASGPPARSWSPPRS
jgi:hypothetical protein